MTCATCTHTHHGEDQCEAVVSADAGVPARCECAKSPACVHHWLIATPEEVERPEDGLPGVCKHCGEVKAFPPPWYEYEAATELSHRLENLQRERSLSGPDTWGDVRHARFVPRARHGTWTLYGDTAEA